MNEIMVFCTTTGKAISTGILTDKYTLDHLPATPSTVRCPHCGTSHQWSARDAWMETQDAQRFGPASGTMFI